MRSSGGTPLPRLVLVKLGAQGLAERAAYDLLTVTERCAHCPDWVFTGTAQEGREAARAHRLEFHPEAVQRRRKIRPKVQSAAEQIKASEAARIKRAFLLGIDLDSALE